MTTKQKGLLVALIQPSATIEDEFNAWYDTEHLPERKLLPGFETARRYVAVEGGPKYLALYDLESLAALRTSNYLAISGDNRSPWTRRVLARAHGHRIAGAQIYPGTGITGDCARLILLRFGNLPANDAESVIAGLRKNFERLPEVLQLRAFHYELDGVSRFLCLVECAAPVMTPLDTAAFGNAVRHLEIIASYRPYP